LMLLAHRALEDAAAANDLRPGRSQTARAILRRLPEAWHPRAGLAEIVTTEELVRFGGRALDEERFAACLRSAGPILRGAPA
ncbi:MAG: DUF4129 domain-containing protein, partial [Pseudomonadota bacterium]